MELEKTYQHQQVEGKIYQLWEKNGFFTPQIKKNRKPFVITLPPPNVTGSLHAGHAMCVIEDILARYHRLKGEPTLFLPGFDHASIAVEYLVNKQILKTGKNKQEIGREEFLEQAKKFADDSREYIRKQLKLLGFSMDWSREAYTMDKSYSQAVKEAFRRLYKKGLIYQGEYIVNWCPDCKTAISDLENEYQEEKSKLYYIKYGPLTVATTRPETIFADVAVAVSPKIKKYQKLVGQNVPLPLTSRKIPVIKEELVDPKFGTGALKITPGHDATDFLIGQKHCLSMDLKAIDFDGKLTKLTGPYQGLRALEARERVVKDLKDGGFLEKEEDYSHSVGRCQRCGSRTEPLISKQWFIKMDSLAQKAIEAVKKGEIEIVPKRFEKVYFHWLENIRDWCISRQLWWGHEIPLKGEKDVLDTWFSSSLWPIATLGWPEKTEDLEYFYPTTVRETGYDILFFWVAREIMMCLEMTGKIPFKTIYLHGLVRDEKGQKFSKTKGIGFDPLAIMEKYGTDALRFALIVGNAPGRDLKITEDKIKAQRNFANKIWNASRFILQSQVSNIKYDVLSIKPTHKDDRWILKELDRVVKKTTKMIDKYRFDLAAYELYHFFWHTFCDQYIEKTKTRKQEAMPVLLKILKTNLILLHPFMPFITEEIYQKLPLKNKKKALIVEEWPR